MLDKAQQDFSYYSHEFKDNYRKGVHRLRTLLETPTQAEAFAANFGGVSVILGAQQDQPDRNSEELYALLQGSDVIDQAVLTWFTGIYTECTTADDVFGDLDRCEEILANPVMSRAAGASGVCAGKWVATLAGQSCNSFEDITAVAASATAMAAVAASWTAVAAIHRGGNLSVIQQTPSAWAVFTACGSGVIGPAVADLAGLDPADYADMDAVVASELAMDAVVASYISIAAVYGTPAAYAVWKDTAYAAEAMASASSVAVGKAAVELAGLDPDDYADAAAVAASSTAMQAVAATSAARSAIEASGTAKSALYNSALKQSISSIAATSSWGQRRTGKVWLISVKQSWSGPSNHTMQHRYTLEGNSTISCTCQQCYNTDYRIDRFMDSITNYCSAGSIGNACTYYFIPCA